MAIASSFFSVGSGGDFWKKLDQRLQEQEKARQEADESRKQLEASQQRSREARANERRNRDTLRLAQTKVKDREQEVRSRFRRDSYKTNREFDSAVKQALEHDPTLMVLRNALKGDVRDLRRTNRDLGRAQAEVARSRTEVRADQRVLARATEKAVRVLPRDFANRLKDVFEPASDPRNVNRQAMRKLLMSPGGADDLRRYEALRIAVATKISPQAGAKALDQRVQAKADPKERELLFRESQKAVDNIRSQAAARPEKVDLRRALETLTRAAHATGSDELVRALSNGNAAAAGAKPQVNPNAAAPKLREEAPPRAPTDQGVNRSQRADTGQDGGGSSNTSGQSNPRASESTATNARAFRAQEAQEPEKARERLHELFGKDAPDLDTLSLEKGNTGRTFNAQELERFVALSGERRPIPTSEGSRFGHENDRGEGRRSEERRSDSGFEAPPTSRGPDIRADSPAPPRPQNEAQQPPEARPTESASQATAAQNAAERGQAPTGSAPRSARAQTARNPDGPAAHPQSFQGVKPSKLNPSASTTPG